MSLKCVYLCICYVSKTMMNLFISFIWNIIFLKKIQFLKENFISNYHFSFFKKHAGSILSGPSYIIALEVAITSKNFLAFHIRFAWHLMLMSQFLMMKNLKNVTTLSLKLSFTSLFSQPLKVNLWVKFEKTQPSHKQSYPSYKTSHIQIYISSHREN